MKKVVLSVALIAAIGVTSCKKEQKEAEVAKTEQVQEVALKEVTFGVRGNCGMCKETIEGAANGVEGVAKAIWDVDKKKIDVSFDPSKTDIMAIHKAIAASGYDTDKMNGDVTAYDGLPGCCQYDHAMKMNQSNVVNEDANHHDHEHGHDDDHGHH